MIGEAFEKAAIAVVTDYINARHPEYMLLKPESGYKTITLEMHGGSARQMDTVITFRNSDNPVALLETKWLKDARHHNDKGAWILQLREVKKQYSTIRGTAAVLAGYWTEGVGVMLMNEGGVRMVLVATDEEVYGTLQKPLDDYLSGLGEPTFSLDARTMRIKYPSPHHIANCLIALDTAGELGKIAESWLEFERGQDDDGHVLTGTDLIHKAIDELLHPLPDEPKIETFEISLNIETGNIIYETFTDVEEAIEFIQTYFADPTHVLRRISPRTQPPNDS